MKKINKSKIAAYLILLVSLVCFAFAQQPTLLSLQGKLTNSSTGAKIISADLRVNINDSSGIVFNQNYSNIVSNGIFELTLGSTYQLNLSYNEEYNLSIFVNNDSQLGEPYAFRGGQGQVGAGDIASTESYIFSNVSVIGNISVGGNLSVDTNVLFVDVENDLVGIGTTTPEVALEVEGGVNISGGLNVTEGDVLLATTSGNVGIGTGSPQNTLHVQVSGVTQVARLATSADGAYMSFYDDSTVRGHVGWANGNTLVSGGSTNGIVLASEADVHIGVGGGTLSTTFDNTGNVGIGNTIPNSTLTVTGEVNMTQNVTIFGMKIWNNGTYWCFNQC